jgi:NAD(P) transhydrogenase subunit alpha
MKIAIHRESREGETRVALTPEAVAILVRDGWDVHVQSGAGTASHFTDENYRAAGATVA